MMLEELMAEKEVNELIIDHRNQLFNDAGHIPLHADYKLKATTLRNYTAELAMTSELSLTQSSIAKTNTRFAAEHSFRGAISNVMLIANTHFIEMDEEDVDVRRELKEVPVETRMFYNLITDSRNGVPVVPVKPELITSTDDSTVFIFCGSNNKPDEFRLVTKKSCWNKGTNSVYNVDECDHMNGMRVKLTWTLSGGGTCAPLFVTVTGLNDRELPTAQMLVVQVAGLCIGGSGVGANEQEGYIVFTKSGQDQKRFEFYQSNVLFPFINSLRKEYSDFDISDGITIPDELTAVAWCDGDLPQVNAIVSNHNLFTEMKVIANKQNAARTGVEQPADLAKVFVIFKQQNKTHTVAGIDPSRHPMKMRVTKAFNSEALRILNLNSKKKSSLIDFISTLPELATKAATRGNILHGFYESGLIDRTKSRYPVLLKVLGTCRSTIPKELYQES